MRPRDPREHHRVSTPLELFFDLTFVVAVAQAAAALHHGMVDGHAGEVLGRFPLAFFGIWWAWSNFTWFASAYDTDDALYRVLAFVQMTGVLVYAAGTPRIFEDNDWSMAVAGYVIMRLPMVAQWLRVARGHPEGRVGAIRYAVGISVVQLFWIGGLLLPKSWLVPGFLALGALELSIPAWAARARPTDWHPHHIAERYGLFTIIVLGESILSAALGTQDALDADVGFGPLAPTIIGGLLVVFAMWWVYFDLPRERVADALRDQFDGGLRRHGFLWAYGHVIVFGAIAATGAGLAVAIDHAVAATAPDPDHPFALSDVATGATVTVPLALYVLTVWWLHRAHKEPSPLPGWLVPFGAAALLALTFTPEPVLLAGVALAAVVAAHAVVGVRPAAAA